MLNVDRSAVNIFHLPKSCLELFIFICYVLILQILVTSFNTSLLDSPLSLQTTLKVDLTKAVNAQYDELRYCLKNPEDVNVSHWRVALIEIKYIYIYIYTRVGTLIVATIYLQLIQNTSRYMFRSFTVLQCSHQHCVQPVASDMEVVGYL